MCANLAIERGHHLVAPMTIAIRRNDQCLSAYRQTDDPPNPRNPFVLQGTGFAFRVSNDSFPATVTQHRLEKQYVYI